jgi:hypothetical protein
MPLFVALSGRLFDIAEPGPLVREAWVAGRRPEASPARPRRVVCVRGLHPAGILLRFLAHSPPPSVGIATHVHLPQRAVPESEHPK